MSSSPTPASRGGAVGKLPVHDERDERRGQEAVAERPEAVAVRVVEPEEEDAREHEVPDEVEDVHRAHELGHAQERLLQPLLPLDVREPLDD